MLCRYDCIFNAFHTVVLDKLAYLITVKQWDPIAFRNTLLHVVHSSSYGPDHDQGLTETCCPIEIIYDTL